MTVIFNGRSHISKIRTKESLREDFLGTIRDMVHVWNSPDIDGDTKYKLEGLAFSILAMFDGCNPGIPTMDIVMRPHPEDKQFFIDNCEDWIEDGMIINDDVSLHDMWHKN